MQNFQNIEFKSQRIGKFLGLLKPPIKSDNFLRVWATSAVDYWFRCIYPKIIFSSKNGSASFLSIGDKLVDIMITYHWFGSFFTIEEYRSVIIFTNFTSLFNFFFGSGKLTGC